MNTVINLLLIFCEKSANLSRLNYLPVITWAFGRIAEMVPNEGWYDYTGSCTTGAELKFNVARCLYTPRVVRPSGFTRYRLAFDCSVVTFYFQQRAPLSAVHQRESNYDLSPSLCPLTIVSAADHFVIILHFLLKVFFKSTDVFYFRNEHADLFIDTLTNTKWYFWSFVKNLVTPARLCVSLVYPKVIIVYS